MRFGVWCWLDGVGEVCGIVVGDGDTDEDGRKRARVALKNFLRAQNTNSSLKAANLTIIGYPGDGTNAQ